LRLACEDCSDIDLSVKDSDRKSVEHETQSDDYRFTDPLV
jgi:hypothetical protein